MTTLASGIFGSKIFGWDMKVHFTLVWAISIHSSFLYLLDGHKKVLGVLLFFKAEQKWENLDTCHSSERFLRSTFSSQLSRIMWNFAQFLYFLFFCTCCLLLDSLFKGSVLWQCNRDSLYTSLFTPEKKSWNMVQIWRQQEKKSWVCHDTDCTKASFISPKSLKTHKKMKKNCLCYCY